MTCKKPSSGTFNEGPSWHISYISKSVIQTMICSSFIWLHLHGLSVCHSFCLQYCLLVSCLRQYLESTKHTYHSTLGDPKLELVHYWAFFVVVYLCLTCILYFSASAGARTLEVNSLCLLSVS